MGRDTKSELKKRIWLALLNRRLTLYPLAVGVVLMALALGVLGSPALALAGLVISGVGAARLAYDWNYNLDRIAAEEEQALRMEREKGRNRKLDELYDRLLDDDDPEPEEMLGAARAYLQEFRELADSVGSFLHPDMVKKFEQLFQGLVEDLEHTITLHEKAMGQRGAVRQQAMRSREGLKTEIRKSVRELGKAVGKLRGLGETSGNGERERNRKELDALLDAAETAHRQVGEFRERLHRESET